MKTAQLDRKHWRKSAQWFSLSRRHAAAVAADFHAAPLFEEHCYSYLPGRDLPIPARVQVSSMSSSQSPNILHLVTDGGYQLHGSLPAD